MVRRIQQALGVSALAAALAYTALWLAYYQFFSQVQLSPEDVGIDKADLLSQALVGPAVLYLTLGLTYGMWMTAMIVTGIINLRHLARMVPELVEIVRGRPGPSDPPPKRRLSLREIVFLVRREGAAMVTTAWRYTRLTAAGVGIATFAIITIELANEARARGRDLLSGRPVQKPHFALATMRIPLLDIRATPADVAWTTSTDVKDGTPFPPCLLYLGDADATTVLFDPRTGRIHRVPTAAVALQLKPADEHDPSCVKGNDASD